MTKRRENQFTKGDVTFIEKEDGMWTIVSSFLPLEYQHLNEGKLYRYAYYTFSDFHIYTDKGPIYTNDGKLLECTDAKEIEENVLEIVKQDKSRSIVIGDDVFDITSIKYIRTNEKEHFGLVFLEADGSLYFKPVDSELEVIIEQDCKDYSVEYDYSIDKDDTADFIISITAETQNKEQKHIIHLQRNKETNTCICDFQLIEEKV